MIPPAMCTKVPLAKDSAPGGVDVVEKRGGGAVCAGWRQNSIHICFDVPSDRSIAVEVIAESNYFSSVGRPGLTKVERWRAGHGHGFCIKPLVEESMPFWTSSAALGPHC